MIIKPSQSIVNTFIFIDKDFTKVIEKLNIYTELARKFVNKHKKYQYMKHIERLPNTNWCLVFKVLPSNHESIKEYNRMIVESKKLAWVDYLNDEIIG